MRFQGLNTEFFKSLGTKNLNGTKFWDIDQSDKSLGLKTFMEKSLGTLTSETKV